MHLKIRPTILTSPPGTIGYDSAMMRAGLSPRQPDLIRARYLPRLTDLLRRNSAASVKSYMESPCWLWTKSTTQMGWPKMAFKNHNPGGFDVRPTAMRPAEIWLALVSIPARLTLEPERFCAPRCGDRLCVNPDHFKELNEREFAQWELAAGPPLVVQAGIRVSMVIDPALATEMAKLERKLVGASPKEAARTLIEAGWKPKDIAKATGMSTSWIYKERTRLRVKE